MSSMPTGNGEHRGPESAGQMGTPLPGSRPERAAANNRKHANFLGQKPVADQDGFGTEDMIRPANYLGHAVLDPADWHCKPPDLSVMGNAGETFGGA